VISRESRLTIGPNASVAADLTAKNSDYGPVPGTLYTTAASSVRAAPVKAMSVPPPAIEGMLTFRERWTDAGRIQAAR